MSLIATVRRFLIAHPLMQFFGVAATVRASLCFYNTRDEVDRFVLALEKARHMLA